MKRIHIVAAIIFNQNRDKIFITKRHKDAHKGGLWEFPGGKVEIEESAEQGMIRELFEEVDIRVSKLSHFERFDYDYDDKSLAFDFFVVTEFENTPYGKEGQDGEWVSLSNLRDYPFPEANVPVLDKLLEQFLDIPK